MQINLGSSDRIIRIIIGIALLAFFLRDDAWRWLGLASLVLFFTAQKSFCPIYRVLGIRTCRIAAPRGKK